MSKSDVVRAWKDPLYRASLSREEIAGLPAHPSGLVELDEEQLKRLAGGQTITTARTCTEFSFNNMHACCPH